MVMIGVSLSRERAPFEVMPAMNDDVSVSCSGGLSTYLAVVE